MKHHLPSRLLGAACLAALALAGCHAYPAAMAPGAPVAAPRGVGLVLDAGDGGTVTLTRAPGVAPARRLMVVGWGSGYQATDVATTEVALYRLTTDAENGEHATLKRKGTLAGDPTGQAIAFTKLRPEASYRVEFVAKHADGRVITSPGVQAFDFTVDADGGSDLAADLTLQLAASTGASTIATFHGIEVHEGGLAVKGYVQRHGDDELIDDGVGLVAAKDGTTYVLSGDAVAKFHPDGSYDFTFDVLGLTAPKALALDAAEANLYIADTGADRVVRVAVGGGTASAYGDAVDDPMGIAVGPDQNVYVSSGKRVLRINALGDVGEFVSAVALAEPDTTGLIMAGPTESDAISFNDGRIAAKAATLSTRGLAFDRKGNLYLAEAGNGNIWKASAAGVLTRVRQFTGTEKPLALVYGTDERVYLTTSANRVLAITGTDTPELLAGGATSGGNVDAYGADVRFFGLGGLAQDGDGYLYVVDNGPTPAVRKIF